MSIPQHSMKLPYTVPASVAFARTWLSALPHILAEASRLLLAALACLTLTNCVGILQPAFIADRSLTPAEQRFVGTWTSTSYVEGVGWTPVAVQFGTDRTIVQSFRSPKMQRTLVGRWEVLNDKLHETSTSPSCFWSCIFHSDTYVNAASPRLTHNLHRRSRNLDVSVESLLAQYEPIQQSSGGFGLFNAVAPDGRVIQAGSPEWVAWMEKKNAEADARSQSGDGGLDDSRRPICRKCGNVIWGASAINGSLCSSCRRGPSPWSNY